MPGTEGERIDDNNRNSSNAVQNGSSQESNGDTGRMKIRSNLKQEGGVSEAGKYPDRAGQQDCMYYLWSGSCGYGADCRYNHPNYVTQDAGMQDTAMYGIGGELPERDGEPDCAFFLKTGTCKYGSSCKYNHPMDKNGAGPVSFNILGLPMRPEEIPCKYYLRTGQCKFGPACKFHHPQPAVPGPVFPVNGNVTHGSFESSNEPARAFPALPLPLPLPASTYIYDYPMHAQAYIPMGVSPHHGFFPQQGWNIQSGNTSYISSTSTFGSSPSYSSNSKSLGESGSNGKVQYAPILTSYPERPGRPECRYYINYGACKYGMDCKFNHPKERNGQMLQQNLIPLPYTGQNPMYGFGFTPYPLPLQMPKLFGRKSSNVVISPDTSSPSKSNEDLVGMHNADSVTDKTQHTDTNEQQASTLEKPQDTVTNEQQESTLEKTQDTDTKEWQEPTTEKTQDTDTNGTLEDTAPA